MLKFLRIILIAVVASVVSFGIKRLIFEKHFTAHTGAETEKPAQKKGFFEPAVAAILPPPVTVSGVVLRGSHITVMFSDGKVVTDRDRKLRKVDEEGVVYGGKFFEFTKTTYTQPAANEAGRREMPVATVH